jgi:hypothetical protein
MRFTRRMRSLRYGCALTLQGERALQWFSNQASDMAHWWCAVRALGVWHKEICLRMLQVVAGAFDMTPSELLKGIE